MKKIARVGFLAMSFVLLFVPCIGAADVYCPPLGVRVPSLPEHDWRIACTVVNYKAGRSPDIVTITVFDGTYAEEDEVTVAPGQFGVVELKLAVKDATNAGCMVKGGGSDLRVSLQLYDADTNTTVAQTPCPPSQ